MDDSRRPCAVEIGLAYERPGPLLIPVAGILESVKVAGNRHEVTLLPFIVPYDFTDAATARSIPDKKRWAMLLSAGGWTTTAARPA